MNDKQLEERLDLLKSTYDRVPTSSVADEVIQQLDKETLTPPTEEKTKSSYRQKAVVWAVSLASVFVIGILGSSFLMEDKISQQEEQMADETKAFIDHLKEQYPKEREKRRQMLNLSEQDFAEIGFISSADTLFNFYVNRTDDYINFADQDERYNRLIDELMLPSEMIQELHSKSNGPIDKLSTVEFLNTYYNKIASLKDYANKQLTGYKDELSAYNKGIFFNLENIHENEGNLSDGFQQLQKSAYKQGLTLELIENGLDIHYVFDWERYKEKALLDKLDPISIGYLQMMAQEPFTYAGEFLYPLEEITVTLRNMETYLLDEMVRTNGSNATMETYYTSVLYNVIKGTKENKIFDESGRVKADFQKNWAVMTASVEHANSPVAYLLPPIMNEFEKSGWQSSSTWHDLSYGDVEDALHLAKNGDLEQFMPDTISKSEDEVPVDGDFLQRVHGLFKMFAGTHDQTVLKGASPEEIVGLYYYCAQLNDFKTQYALYIKDDNYMQISEAEYLSGEHQVITRVSDEITSMRFSPHTDGNGVVTLTLHSDGTLSKYATELSFQLIQTENGWRPPFMPIQ